MRLTAQQSLVNRHSPEPSKKRTNDSLMEGISDAGNGIYGVISDETQMRTYVHERLLSTLVHIAKDVKIQVEFNPEKVLAYRLLGYENRAIADSDFRNDGIDVGEIGAGHKVTALYELAGGTVPTARAGTWCRRRRRPTPARRPCAARSRRPTWPW
jgi:Ca-activated chloride channel family protein